ncbi:polysaccharide pyruvyl transferase family protein [Serratia oryzae]|uniref:polysaccharide pyruvyl transferase family protein n=1 Tax=Serratia oryzae TaxID=2034155 RepID=UPI0012E1E6E8|nr:polysaccharide pyruvyl transferase family protein [Serratia oryzae]
MKVLVFCEADGKNLGDAAIFQGLESLLHGNDLTKMMLGLPIKSSVLHTSGTTKGRSVFAFLKRYTLFYTTVTLLRLLAVKSLNLKSTIRNIKKNDIVIVGGGSLLINNNYVFPLSLSLITLLCKIYKKKYIILGCSTRPIDSSIAKSCIKYHVSNAAHIYMRDNLSINILKDYFNIREVSFIPDLALFNSIDIHNRDGNNIKEGRKVAINIMGRTTHGAFSKKNNIQKYKSAISETISFLVSKQYSVSLFTTGEDGDEELMLELAKATGLNSLHPKSTYALFDFIDGNDVIVSTRLHAGIISIARCKGVVPIIWDSKVKGFFESIQYDGQSIDLTDIDFSTIYTGIVNASPLKLNIDSYRKEIIDVIKK